MTTPKQYLETHRERFLNELFELLRIPSLSADSAYKGDIQKAASWVKDNLLSAGADKAEVFQTKGHPIVYGEKFVDKNAPTVLVYGHYDVQPADPVELWETPAFEPTIKKTEIHPNGAVFARGACDDKGQMFMQIKAFECLAKTDNLRCNVKFMIEGEEEIGSPSLEVFVEENKELLKCDVVLVSDTGMISMENPSITVGLRGLSYVEVEAVGPNRDLHSGLYGGAVANPINALCEMIAALKDENGTIAIPGFYEDALPITESAREELARIPFSQERYNKSIGITKEAGEKGYSTIERASIRPTIDVNGIWGGYTGEGSKTVLPSKAYAKISMRLVPGQSPAKITELFKKHFEASAPDGVTVTVKPHHGGEPYLTPTNFAGYQAASAAIESTFGKKPIAHRGGGSIPIVALFEEHLNVKTLLLGFGLDTDAIHSPNEHFGLDNFYKGIETIPLFYQNYCELMVAQEV
jgi:acetylornithine deacetylase/succinyl-diaminopimelate desuccinylase-like protein